MAGTGCTATGIGGDQGRSAARQIMRRRAAAGLRWSLQGGTALTPVLLVVALSVPAAAQMRPEAEPRAKAQLAQRQDSQRFEIAPQDLTAALDRFSEQTGISFAYKTGDLAGIRSSGVSGTMPQEAALDRLLAGTGIRFEFTGDNTVTLADVGAQDGGGPQRLGPITVEADSDVPPADDPAEGYKADVATTVTRIPLPIQETPSSIGVVTKDFIEDTGATARDDALEQVSGVSRGGALRGQQSITLRGFQLPDFGYALNGNTSINARPVDPALIERIEIPKGPSSIVSGAGSPGGTVNIITKNPQPENFVHLTQELGSFGRAKSIADLNGVLPQNDAIRGRLVTTYSPDTGNFVDDTDSEEATIAPAIEIDTFDGNGEFRLSGRYNHFDGVHHRGVPLVATTGKAPDISPETNVGGGEDNGAFNNFEGRYAQVQYEHNFIEGLSLTARGGYQNTDLETADVYAFEFGGGIPASGDINIYASNRTLDKESLAGELFVSKDLSFLDQQHQFSFGVDYRNQSRDAFLEFAGPESDNIFRLQNDFEVPSSGFTLFTDRTFELEQTGLFGQVVLRPIERFTITLGGRQDWAEFRQDARRRGVVAEGDPSEFTGRVGASFQASDWATIYASFQESFNVQSATEATGELVPPETGESYEVGTKFNFFDGDLGVTTALFRTYRQNVATPDPNNPGFSIVTGEQRHQGVELDVNGEPLPGLNLSGQLSYIDAEISADPNRGIVGNSPSGVPDNYVGRIFATYEFQSGFLDGFGFGGGMFFHSGFVVDIANNFKTDSYERFDAVAFYKATEGLELSLTVRNLTDERYIESPGTPSANNQFGPPLSVFGAVKVKF